MTLPSWLVPLSCSMAALASSEVKNLTKPKPRDSSERGQRSQIALRGMMLESRRKSTHECEGRT
jgi:hypothetical protein